MRVVVCRDCGQEAEAYDRDTVCKRCGEPADTVDHIDPLSRGGENTWENLTAACRSCNSAKNAKPLLSFLLARG